MQLELAPYDIKGRAYCFPSGLRIDFQEDHTQPIVAVTSVIDRGSEADPEGKEGIAHLIEHLWFRSKHGDGPKTWDLLDEMGASINAFTAADVTTFMTVAPRSFLDAVLTLEVARLTEPMRGVGDEEVNAEREIVRNELREGENSLEAGLPYVFAKLYPKGHPYSRMTIGTHETLNHITLDDVHAFVDAGYKPANATIMVVGDFSLDESPAIVSRTIPPALAVDPAHPDAPIQLVACPARIQGPSAEPPPPVDQTLSTEQAGVDRRVAVLAWSLPGGYRPDEPLMELSSYALAGALSRYLNPSSVGRPDSEGVWCSVDPGEYASTMLCGVELSEGADPAKIVKKAVDGLYTLWDSNAQASQKIYYEVSRYRAMAGVFSSADEVASLFGGRATTTALHTHFTGSSAYFSDSLNALRQVDAHQAAGFARKYLNRDRVVSVVLEPYKKEGIETDSAEGQYRGHPREAVTHSIIDPNSIDAPLIERLALAPTLTGERSFELDNGLQVVVLPHGEVPMARAALVFRGGSLTEPTLGIDRMAWYATVSDTEEAELVSGRTPLRLGGGWDDRRYPDATVLGVYGSSANLDGLLQLLADRVQTQHVTSSGSAAMVRELRRELQDDRDQPEYWAQTISAARLLPGTAQARVTSEESIDHLGTLQAEDLQHYDQSLYQPANATLVVVGRVDPDQVETWARASFGAWGQPASPRPATHLPLPDPPARQILLFDKPRTSQSMVDLACQIGPADAGTEAARTMLSSVLSEMSWVTLRESSGVTYGAYAGIDETSPDAAVLHLDTLVQNDAVGLAAQTFLAIVERARGADLDAKLLRLLQLENARKNILRYQSSTQMLRELVHLARFGGEPGDLTAFPGRLAAVDVSALSSLMQRCAGHEVLSVVGPKDIARKQLEERQIPVELYDWEAERDRLWQQHDPAGFKRELARRAKP